MSNTLSAGNLAKNNCPTITLRKGKTELQIKNAAAIIKRIDEMYPNTSEYSWAGSTSPKTERVAQHEKQKQWVESAKHWFQKEMFGDVGEFELVVSEPTEKEQAETKFSEKYDETEKASREAPLKYDKKRAVIVTPEGEITPEAIDQLKEFSDQATQRELLTDSPRSNQIPVKTVNKNAYEIRADILAQALDWTRFKKETSSLSTITDEDVISTAQKFYRFVENRR